MEEENSNLHCRKDFTKVPIIPSKGKSGAIVPMRDNFLVPDSVAWPPMEVVSKMYKSNHLSAFADEYKAELTSELGYYCDLYSIKSEDAMTWSLFGYISCYNYEVQNKFYNELLGKLRLLPDTLIKIELWKRLPHPETFVSGGPEIDVCILGTAYCLLIECKWGSSVGTKQGIHKDLDQLQIRNHFANGIGKKIFPNKECVTVLLGTEADMPKVRSEVEYIPIQWEDIARFDSLPHKTDFIAYLEWKKKLATI